MRVSKIWCLIWTFSPFAPKPLGPSLDHFGKGFEPEVELPHLEKKL